MSLETGPEIIQKTWHATKFSGQADFDESTFREGATFALATFNRYADFGGTNFSGSANFAGTTFSGYSDIRGAKFGKDVEFKWAKFRENADLRKAIFNGNAYFKEAKFGGDAYFRGTKFSRLASFQEAEFDGNIEFGDTRFENETSFYRILFKRPAYFENCSIKSLNLTKAEYSRLYLRWTDIKSLHFDESAYLFLIKNYNNLGWYGDENEYYYNWRNAVRENWMMASSTGIRPEGLKWILRRIDLLIDYMELLLYGYGVRTVFPMSWSAFIILAFGLFFRQKMCLRKIITEERIEDAKNGSDEVLVQTKAKKAPINSLDPLLFSLFTFTSGFTSFLHPSIEYKLERCMRWAILERLLGPFFMALVITAISKTYLIR